MAFTIVGMRKTAESGNPRETTVFVSQEYVPHKERDAVGGVLPNQEWQHPDPETLHYCRLGALTADVRVEDLIESILDLGAGQMGGHVRILFQEHAPWIEERLESWRDRHERRAREEQEYEREREMQAAAQASERAPVYDCCPRCNSQTEQCKSPIHRGQNRCMRCNGGVSNIAKRHCDNCNDLKYREKREAALGHPIAYAGEES
jgi:hypothetical protein